MSDFKSALGNFLVGKLEFAGLEAALHAALQADPAAAPEILQLIESTYRAGRLPPQLYAMMKARVAQVGVGAPATPAPPPADDSDKTRIRMPPGAPTPGAADSDRTQVRLARPVPPTPDVTSPPGTHSKPPSGLSIADADSDRTVVYTATPVPPTPDVTSPPGTHTKPPSGPPIGDADSDRTVVHTATPVPPMPDVTSPPGTQTEPPSGPSIGAADSDRTVVHTATPVPPTPDATSPAGTQTEPPSGPSIADENRPGPVTGNARTTPTSGATGSDFSWTDMTHAAGQSGETLQVGSVLKGRFVFEELIGHGGMGEVYKARDLRKEEAQDRNPHIAVKILNESFKSHPESLKALQRESRKAQNLAHPNIVNVFDFDRDGGNVYMTMEFLEGDPLDVLIKSVRGRGLEEAKALLLVNEMGQALAYAHKKGVVHSDFKPGNAFLTHDGVVKVFDFGIARATKVAGQSDGEKTLFDAGELGALTPAYASHEMLEGEEPDARDDIYALACVAYELLTGQHPFNKLPANQAKEKRLTPAPIKGLSRRQWKGLLHGLAFERGDRSPDVNTFLAEIARKKVSKGVIAGMVTGMLLVAVLLGLLLPDYLHKRRIATIIEALKSGDTPAINEALARVETLDGDDREQVVREAKGELIDWSQVQIDAAIDETQGRYDYLAAERIAKTALGLYPDSARIQSLKDRVESRKNQLLNELNTRYNQYLADGRLLLSAGDDIDDVLKVLAQVQPDHPLLSDPRLAAAYAEQATQLFESAELVPALAMISAGLSRYPDDIYLVNLRDRISTEEQRIQHATRIAELERKLDSALESLTSLEAVDTLREPVEDLRDLKSDASVLTSIYLLVSNQLDLQLQPLIAGRDWEAARAMLGAYADMLDSARVQQGEQRIAGAEHAYRKQIDGLYAALLDAAAKRRLDPAAENSAQQQLAALEAAGADSSLLDQGRASIGQAYLELARESRAAKRWEAARRYAQQGLQTQPGEGLQASLHGERVEITRAEEAAQQQMAQAEREAQERQRQAKIQQFHDAFEQSLTVANYNAVAGSASIRTLEQLAAVNPTDPLIGTGRIRVAEHLVQQITALSAKGQWEQALALASDAVKVIPGSELLSKTQLDIERGQAQQLAMERKRKIEQYKQSLATLLGVSVIDRKWETQLRSDLKGLTELLPADAPWLATLQEQIATRYLDKARAMRDSQRFSEAASLLERGAKFAPRSMAFAEEAKVLAKAEAAFNKANQEKLRMARIEGNKQTLLTQAKANDLRNAKKTLQALRKELPADDPFLVTTAQQALAGAYLRLADGAARKKNFDSAMKLIRAGIQIAPDMPELERAQARYERGILVDKKSRQFAAAKTLNVKQEKQILAGLEAADKGAYKGVKKELAAALYQRVRAYAAQDFKAAEKLLASARQLFPADKRLAGLKIAAPVAKALPAVKPKPVPVAPPTTKKPAPAVQTAKTRTGSCRPTLAGYGRRSRGTCYDLLSGDAKGPLLVVVPAGNGIDQPYAISKYEISVNDYNKYCRTSGECSGVKAGSADLPVTGISFKQAKAYAAWISKQSGYTYRLPTEQEWTYAANAQGKQPAKDFNCRLLLGNQVIKGQALGSVKMGKPNGWGLKNYIGNAQEWVVTPGGVVARGGAFSDSLSNCSISLSKRHNGKPDRITGFRLVRDFKVGS